MIKKIVLIKSVGLKGGDKREEIEGMKMLRSNGHNGIEIFMGKPEEELGWMKSPKKYRKRTRTETWRMSISKEWE